MRLIVPEIFLLKKKEFIYILLGEVCRQLESLRMAMTRDRDEERDREGDGG